MVGAIPMKINNGPYFLFLNPSGKIFTKFRLSGNTKLVSNENK